jgi:hypothetical protein
MANKMITIKIGTNLNREAVIVNTGKTLREVLDENNINYATTTIFVDGVNLKVGDMDKTLDALNIGDGAYIIAAQKTENA